MNWNYIYLSPPFKNYHFFFPFLSTAIHLCICYWISVSTLLLISVNIMNMLLFSKFSFLFCCIAYVWIWMGNDEASSFRFFAVSECVCWNFFGDIYLLLEILAPFGHDFNASLRAHRICLSFSFCFSIHFYWFLYTSMLNCRTGNYFGAQLICLQSEFFALMCRPFLCIYFLV